MKLREGEAARQAYITKRISDADLATRDWMIENAYEIGVALVHFKRIDFAQRILKRPRTPRHELELLSWADIAALADRLESEALSRIDTL